MSLLSAISDFINSPKPAAAPQGGTSDSAAVNPESFLSGDQKTTETYKILVSNWYKAQPYGFKISMRDGKNLVMFLPINPSNIQISTNFATNIIPTLYGTVEEHSDVRYYDISIRGTTGIAPRHINPQIKKGAEPGDYYKTSRQPGRTSFAVAQSASGSIAASGFFQKTLGALNNALNKASELANGSPKPKHAFSDENSGYVAFHNLYRALLQYKKDAAGISSNRKRKDHPLTFFNYKDNNQYDVAVRNFTMERSAENPMLYNYSIQLRGYNLSTVGGTKVDEDLAQRQTDLGIDGVQSSSLLSDMKKISNGAKSIVGSLVSGINILGR
jgi:hypothetical protein